MAKRKKAEVGNGHPPDGAEQNEGDGWREGVVAIGEKLKRGRQTHLKGDGFPGPPPDEVCEARDQYLSSMRSHAKAAKKKAESEQDLIEAMHKHNVTRVQLDGENKYFEIEAPEKIKTKTVPKEQREERESRESEN